MILLNKMHDHAIAIKSPPSFKNEKKYIIFCITKEIRVKPTPRENNFLSKINSVFKERLISPKEVTPLPSQTKESRGGVKLGGWIKRHKQTLLKIKGGGVLGVNWGRGGGVVVYWINNCYNGSDILSCMVPMLDSIETKLWFSWFGKVYHLEII